MAVCMSKLSPSRILRNRDDDMMLFTAHNYHRHSSNRTVTCVHVSSVFVPSFNVQESSQKNCEEMMARACDLAGGIVDKKLFSAVILIRYYVPNSDWRQIPSSSTVSITPYIYILVLGDFHTLHKLTSWACALLNIYDTTSDRRYEMRNHKILIFYMPFVLVLGLFHTPIEPILSWSAGGASCVLGLKPARHVCHWPDFILCIWCTFMDSHEAWLPFNYSTPTFH